ncbi:MAG: TonB-dependent receptor [Caulobacteraceae bacterium]|nr:TonB-dependent receptor [Caulobacteraceae bacterium]
MKTGVKTRGALLAGLCSAALCLAGGAFAQTAATPPVAESSVTPYAAAFFTEYRPATALDMVQRVPGFSVDGGSDVRGLAGAAGNVLIDGERPPGKASLYDALQRIPAAQVERIELVRGGASGIDMQGKSMVANIIRAKDRPAWSGAVKAWGFGAERADYKEGNVQLSGAHDMSHGRIEGDISYDRWGGEALRVGETRRLIVPGGAILSDSASSGNDNGLSMNGSLGSQTPLWGGDLSLNYSHNEYDTDGGQTERFTTGAPRLQANANQGENNQLGARYTRKFGPVELEGQVSDTARTSDNASTSIQGGSPSSFLGHSKSGESVARGTARWSPFPSISLEGGAETAFNFLDGSSAISLNGVLSPVPGSAARVEETRGEEFAVATWRAPYKLTLEAGLHYEASTLSARGIDKSLAFAKPSLQATWQGPDGLQLQARVERSVSQLDFGAFLSSASLVDQRVRGGASDLTPTQAWVSAFELQKTFWDKGVFKLRFEDNAYDDLIGNAPVTVAGQVFEATANIGSGRRSFVNFQLDAPLDRLGLKGARISLSGNRLIRSELTDPFTGELRGQPGDGDFRLDGRFEQDLPRLNLTWGVTAGRQGLQPDWRRDGRDWYRESPNLGFYMNYKPNSQTTLSLDLMNLASRKFVNVRTFYAGQRDNTPLSYTEISRQRSTRQAQVTLRRAF